VPLVFAQPGHWLGPVTGLGWLGHVGCAEPNPKKNFAGLGQFKKNNKKIKIKSKKIKNKKYVCMDKK